MIISIVKKDDFIFLYPIGRGCFGKVYKAKHRNTNKIIAIKQMSKTKIIDSNSERSVMQERLFLSNLRNKFIVNMIFSFQDSINLYLGLELMKGGDLRYHLINYSRNFTESQLKFLVSNLIMGLEYIHSQNIIHRDLKPENILFDNNGFAYITDFNISCKKEEINTNNDISGTPVYMAPESIFLREQGFGVDFYSLGIICYECIMGQRPYEGDSRQEIQNLLNENNYKIRNDEGISDLCQSLINGLLEKNPGSRLGSQSGTVELKEHLFFKGFSWDLLENKKYVSPLADIIKYSKSRSNNLDDELFDQEYCNKTEEIDEDTNDRYKQIMDHENYPNYFRQYTYFSKDGISEIMNKNTGNGSNRPPKMMHSNRSMENLNLPRLKTRSKKSISISNGGHNYHEYHEERQRQHYHKPKYSQNSYHDRNRYRYHSKSSNNYSLINYYENKINKYKQLLRQKEQKNLEDDYVVDVNNYPNLFYPPAKNLYKNDNINYNDACNDIQNKIYKRVFDGLDEGKEKYLVKKQRIRGGNPPNQFQINNYFPPPCMMGMAMGMGMYNNPYNMMMNPFLNNNAGYNNNYNNNNNNNNNYNNNNNNNNNNNELQLPDIYDNGKYTTYHHHHHHKSKSYYTKSKYSNSKYSKSSYSKTSTKHHHHHKSSKKKSEKSESTTTHKKSKKKSTVKSTEKTEKSKKTKKSSEKGKKSEKNEDDDKKKKKKKKKDEEEEEEENEGEENEDDEGEENEDDEGNEGEENEDDEGEGDGDGDGDEEEEG